MRKKIYFHSGQFEWVDKNKESSKKSLIIKIILEVVISARGLTIVVV